MTNYASDLDRIREELADSFDEELEMELDESRLESLLIDAPDSVPSPLREAHEALAGQATEIMCAAPIAMQTLAPTPQDENFVDACIRIAGYWHGIPIEGPGRRSVV